MTTETLTNVIEKMESEKRYYVKGTWEHLVYCDTIILLKKLNYCFGLRWSEPYRAHLERKEDLIPFMEDVFEEQLSVRIGQEFSFELMFANAVLSEEYIGDWEPNYFTTGVLMEEPIHLLTNYLPNIYLTEVAFYIHLEDDVFVKYLWLARNSFAYGGEKPTEDEIKRYDAIIDRYCLEKGVVLDDEGFDYFDIMNNFQMYYLLEYADRFTAENAQELIKILYR